MKHTISVIAILLITTFLLCSCSGKDTETKIESGSVTETVTDEIAETTSEEKLKETIPENEEEMTNEMQTEEETQISGFALDIVDDKTITASECIETPDLKSIEITKMDTSVNDNDSLMYLYENTDFKDATSNTKAKHGDIVMVSYEGTINGETFKDSCQANKIAVLDDFPEDGVYDFLKEALIGMKKGETQIISGTITDKNSQYNGQKADYTITLEHICIYPEFNENDIEKTKTLLISNSDIDAFYTNISNIWSYVYNNSSLLKVKKEIFEKYQEYFETNEISGNKADFIMNNCKGEILIEALSEQLDITDAELEEAEQLVLKVQNSTKEDIINNSSEEAYERTVKLYACMIKLSNDYIIWTE